MPRAGQKNKSKECTLILTEGDSAKAMALRLEWLLSGRQKYGVFPLKGKILNVKDPRDQKKLVDNSELNSIKGSANSMEKNIRILKIYDTERS